MNISISGHGEIRTRSSSLQVKRIPNYATGSKITKVAGEGIEPPTQRFSVVCSTN